MSPRRRISISVLLFVLLAIVGALYALLVPPRSAVDLGAWRVIVLQSDDWGLEGWFPDAESAAALAPLTDRLPPRIAAYGRGGLETADDVRALAALFASREDADGLPFVLQANTIVAAPTVSATDASTAAFGWPLHASGESTGRYARPGLAAAVDTAIAQGVWWPELHGLSHFDLPAYARARAQGDTLAAWARQWDTFAYEGWLGHTELDGHDAQAARTIAREAYDRFVQRFGRPPVSVIAPDYRWGPEDERAWAEVGLEVVQAKREQIDRALRPHTRTGRALKWLRQRWEARVGTLHPLERPAELEPYGDPDPATAQGAYEAAAAVQAAWKDGQPGIISVHRIQLVAFDAALAEAGRSQLLRCLDILAADGPVRCLVDTEVAQLQQRGWSRLDRGPWTVIRNFREWAVEIQVERGEKPRRFEPGTHTLARKPPANAPIEP